MTTSRLGDVATINRRNLSNAGRVWRTRQSQRTLQDYMRRLQQLRGMNRQDLALQTQQQGVNTSLGAQAVGFNQPRRTALQSSDRRGQRRVQSRPPARIIRRSATTTAIKPPSAIVDWSAGSGRVGKVLGNQPNNSLAAPGYNPNPTYTYNPGAYTTNLGVGG